MVGSASGPLLAATLGADLATAVVIVKVAHGSPAEAAGLEPGDIIISADGKTPSDARAFADQLANAPAGPMTLQVDRGGNEISLTVQLKPGPSPAKGVSSSEPTPSRLPKMNPTPNQITGRVVFPDGRPVAGAKIDISGYTKLGKSFDLTTSEASMGPDSTYSPTTDAAGVYRQSVTPGYYGIRGDAIFFYNGQTYTIHLTPLNWPGDASIAGYTDSRPGMVRDFTADTSARLIVADPATFRAAGAWPKDATLRLILIPAAPLLDGTQPAQIVRETPLSGLINNLNSLSNWQVPDLPIGSYTATAETVGANGATSTVQLGAEGQDNRSGVNISFNAQPATVGGTVTVTIFAGPGG